jgi:peroxiredoxin
LRGIEKALSSLESAGVRPIAISADSPEESLELCRKAGITFSILSDRTAEAIRRYDLLVAGAGEDGRDISGTAEFLLDSSGTVRWRKMSETSGDRFVEAAKVLN